VVVADGEYKLNDGSCPGLGNPIDPIYTPLLFVVDTGVPFTVIPIFVFN
jgi:hypothetical protein